jgi:hypothetical protein
MKEAFHFHRRAVGASSHLAYRGRDDIIKYSFSKVGRFKHPSSASGVDTEASTSREANSRQNMYNIVNDAIRSPEYDSGIG